MQDEPHSSQSKKRKIKILKRKNHYNHYILFIFLTKRTINLTLFSLGKYTHTVFFFFFENDTLKLEPPTLPTTSHLWGMTVTLLITQVSVSKLKDWIPKWIHIKWWSPVNYDRVQLDQNTTPLCAFKYYCLWPWHETKRRGRRGITIWCSHVRLICYYFTNFHIQDISHGAHRWSTIEVKAMWYSRLWFFCKQFFNWVFILLVMVNFLVKGKFVISVIPAN